MKSLQKKIKESLDIDNIFWKLSIWFRDNQQEKDSFTELVDIYKAKRPTQSELLDYLNNTNIKYDKLIDFLEDSPLPQEEINYLDLMSKVLDTIIANKEELY